MSNQFVYRTPLDSGTNGLNNGYDIKSISALMGHSSVLTTEKVYTAVLPETLQKTVEKSLNFKI